MSAETAPEGSRIDTRGGASAAHGDFLAFGEWRVGFDGIAWLAGRCRDKRGRLKDLSYHGTLLQALRWLGDRECAEAVALAPTVEAFVDDLARRLSEAPGGGQA